MSRLMENLVVGVVLASAAAVLIRQARGYWSGKGKCCSRGCGGEADKPKSGSKGPMFMPVEDLEKRAKQRKEKKA